MSGERFRGTGRCLVVVGCEGLGEGGGVEGSRIRCQLGGDNTRESTEKWAGTL